MKPPVEYVRVSAKGKETLIKIKRRTGLEHWNEICRVALFRSLSNPTPPQKLDNIGESSIDMEWKTFAGPNCDAVTAIFLQRAEKDGIDISKRDILAEYFRSHLERGISNMQNVRGLSDCVDYK